MDAGKLCQDTRRTEAEFVDLKRAAPRYGQGSWISELDAANVQAEYNQARLPAPRASGVDESFVRRGTDRRSHCVQLSSVRAKELVPSGWAVRVATETDIEIVRASRSRRTEKRPGVPGSEQFRALAELRS